MRKEKKYIIYLTFIILDCLLLVPYDGCDSIGLPSGSSGFSAQFLFPL